MPPEDDEQFTEAIPGEKINMSGEVANRFLTQKIGIEEPWPNLLSKPRVLAGDALPGRLKDGQFQLRFADLKSMGAATLTCFFEEFPPGGVSQRHGHMNGALFYILDGQGYEIHDGERFDWQAGDAAIIPEGCVHRHVNSDHDRPARVLVINPKRVYWFMNLRAQGLVDRPGEGEI